MFLNAWLNVSRTTLYAGVAFLYLAGWFVFRTELICPDMNWLEQPADQRVASALHTPVPEGDNAQYLVPLRERGAWRILLAAMGDPGRRELNALSMGAGWVLLITWLFVLDRGAIIHAGRAALLVGVLLFGSPFYLLVLDEPGTLVEGGLACLALALHLFCTHRRPGDLSIGAALLIGVAAMNHLEWLALWPVMVLHGLLVQIVRRSTEVTLPAVLLKGAAGCCWLVIGLSPALLRNLYALGIPWPPLPQASLVLNGTDGPVQSLLPTLVALWREQAANLYGRLVDQGLSRFAWLVLVWLGGIVWSVTGPQKNRVPVHGLVACLVVILPGATALLSPLTGARAFPVMVTVTLMLLAAAAALTLWDFYWEGPLRHLAPRYRIVVGIGLAASMIGLGTRQVVRQAIVDAHQISAVREVMALSLEGFKNRGMQVVASDVPLDFEASGMVLVDLTCELTPSLYGYPEASAMTPADWQALFNAYRVDGLLLFHDHWQDRLGTLPAVEHFMMMDAPELPEGTGFPILYQVQES
ncbi:MAG: hypothetical protein H7A43_06535 [Verrucomicrobia bacterium]|nr:hypothetical protein [Kiritimatiellia bacterium]MCP5488290.1 hypothetical protein [Verrucomicrobiota bacterium]